MRRPLQLAVSLGCLAVIGAGARYAYGRERLRATDPHDIYQQINRENFAGGLPDVPVTWADAGEDNYGMTHFYEDGTAAIDIDKQKVLSEGFLREVVEHEACHVAVRPEIERSHEDDHGGKWQACMDRFQ